MKQLIIKILKEILPKQALDKLQHIYSQLSKVEQPKFPTTIFRNDDVSFDTNVEHFKEFCSVFHKHGFVQLHAVTLYGRCNCSYTIDGIPAMYDTIRPLDIYDYEACKKVSTDFIGDNKELIEYLNSIPDDIGLHGLYHSNYAAMSYDKQEHDIKEGLGLLHELFPKKNITTFIAPFNMTNDYTYEICKKYGLRVSALEGEHLEENIHFNKGNIKFGELYRYHHHRFYPESTFKYYNLSIERLDIYLSGHNNVLAMNNEGRGGLPSVSLFQNCVEKNKAQNWYVYAYKDFFFRKHASLPYKWLLKNCKKDAKILEVACGAGGMLYFLNATGFRNLSGYDYDLNAVNTCNEIKECMDLHINFYQDDATTPKLTEAQDVIVWVNGMYHLENYSLDAFFETNIKHLSDKGVLIFDMVDVAFNKRPNNEFCSQDVNLPVNKRRSSEYVIRLSKDDVARTCQRHNLRIIKTYSLLKETIPRMVYIVTKK